MKKIAYFAAALAASPSIASAQDGPPLPDDMPPANAPMPAGGGAQVDPNAYISPRNPNSTRTQREGSSIARRWQAESAEGIKPVPGTEGAVLFAFGTSEPSVVCAVSQICDVQLQPGENINSVNVGDSARWSIEPAVSNSGPNETQHLIIKPLDANLNTTSIVTTDRRTYHIRLVSHRTQFMSRVAFTYPDEAQAKWAAFRARSDTARAENTTAVPDGARGTGRGGSEYLSNLDFHYSVDGRARWKPVRVYNDGVKTIIEMSHAMEQTEAPSSSIVRAGGSVSKAADTSIVNYRLQDGRYIVDQIFDQAVLISGVGKRQERAQALVDDSVAESVKLYPPAISRVSIPTTGGGAYGDGLRSSMRQAGYAVIEAGKGVKPDPAATPLRYYVDQPIADSYRVTSRVGAQTFSRIYGVDEKGIYPSAGWALDSTGATPESIERANRPVAPAAPPPVPSPVASTQPGFGGNGTEAGTWSVSSTGFSSESAARAYWRATARLRPSWASVTPRFVQNGRSHGIQFGQFQSSATARAKCKGIRAARCGVVKAG
ncbi:hypothetical protein OY671_007440 [Metschnikowia pulcherrima]|nr:hypothetical protein OY671_007440 [Metschnikowia pulcherrima]